MLERIKQGLEQQWSPEQIQGRCLEEGLDSVCPKTIYDYIAYDKASGGDLHKNLRHKKYMHILAHLDHLFWIKLIGILL